MMPLQAKASDAVEEAANRVQDATSSETVQKVAGKVKAAAKAGDSAPMHGRTAVVMIVYNDSLAACKFAACVCECDAPECSSPPSALWQFLTHTHQRRRRSRVPTPALATNQV